MAWLSATVYMLNACESEDHSWRAISSGNTDLYWTLGCSYALLPCQLPHSRSERWPPQKAILVFNVHIGQWIHVFADQWQSYLPMTALVPTAWELGLWLEARVGSLFKLGVYTYLRTILHVLFLCYALQNRCTAPIGIGFAYVRRLLPTLEPGWQRLLAWGLGLGMVVLY